MDTSIRNRWIIAGIVLLGIILSSVMFSVPEGRVAVVTLFGKPVRTYKTAGLKFKAPLPFERAHIFDARKRVSKTRLTETLTKDKRNVILVTYSVWQIADPVQFMKAVWSIEGAEQKLDGLITNAKNAVMGNYDFTALVAEDPQKQKVDRIEADMLADVTQEARNRYGVDLLQIGIQRLALPEENIPYVFDQMRAEREEEAAGYRAEGKEKAAEIRAETDLEVATVKAEGEQKAEEIRGEAEAQAASIYSDAHKLDPDFYEFNRSLSSMEKMLGKESTIVLDTESPPFDVLKEPQR